MMNQTGPAATATELRAALPKATNADIERYRRMRLTVDQACAIHAHATVAEKHGADQRRRHVRRATNYRAAGVSATDMWAKQLELLEAKGMRKDAAIRHLTATQPDLHSAMLNEANGVV